MNRVSIGSDNGLSPVRRQAITWTNAHLLLIGYLRTNFSEIWIKIQKFLVNAFENVVCEMMHILSRGRWVFCSVLPCGPKEWWVIYEGVVLESAYSVCCLKTLQCVGKTGAWCTNGLSVQNSHLMKMHSSLMSVLIMQLDHNLVHVSEALLMGYVQNCDVIGSL